MDPWIIKNLNIQTSFLPNEVSETHKQYMFVFWIRIKPLSISFVFFWRKKMFSASFFKKNNNLINLSKNFKMPKLRHRVKFLMPIRDLCVSDTSESYEDLKFWFVNACFCRSRGLLVCRLESVRVRALYLLTLGMASPYLRNGYQSRSDSYRFYTHELI